jgi:hypothetical protein
MRVVAIRDSFITTIKLGSVERRGPVIRKGTIISEDEIFRLLSIGYNEKDFEILTEECEKDVSRSHK